MTNFLCVILFHFAYNYPSNLHNSAGCNGFNQCGLFFSVTVKFSLTKYSNRLNQDFLRAIMHLPWPRELQMLGIVHPPLRFVCLYPVSWVDVITGLFFPDT